MASAWAEESDSPDPRDLVDRIRSARLETSAPVSVEGVRLETGFGVLELSGGVLFPVRRVGERSVEMVFLGDGVVEVEPPDAVEAGQLELFTGSRALAERFTEAVFVVARDDVARALLERPPAAAGAEVVRRAQERFRSWRASPERRYLGVDGALLGDAVGDPVLERYFAAWFLGEELGEFLMLVDPTAPEQANLGQFVPLDATRSEKRRVSRVLAREQRRGRLVGLEVEDLGLWDTWISSPLYEGGRPAPGLPAFEPRHYSLDVTVQPKSGELAGRAVLELVATTGGRRLAHLSLHRDLEVSAISVESKELAYLREGTEIDVVLPAAPRERETVFLEVHYSGPFLDRGRDRNWALRDALAWYPHAGEIDRATYDVTLRCPPQFDLVAGGRWVSSGGDKKLRWDRRELDVPALGFSFEVGRFEIDYARAGDVAVTVAFDPNLVAVAGESLAEITRTVTDSLAYYERLFGPYPLDHLVVVTVPRDYSQAMLGFVTLANAMMVDWGAFGPLFGATDRRAVVAHEIAHQWWGHQVGWKSYRDQWVSEAMANYAAGLWSRHRLGQLGASALTSGWQEELIATIDDGRPVASVGPLVLGRRLDSSRSANAYEALVYRKGALVLGMLADLFSEDRFLAMLRAVVEESRGRILSTADFLELLEALADVDLDRFAEQFVYGSGLPEIFYDYDFEEAGPGRWNVRIVARQETPLRYRYEAVARAGGGFDVARRPLAANDLGESTLLVPFQVSLAGSVLGVQGRMEIAGRESELSFELDRRPEDVWLDTRREVYGRFFNERRHPKRMLLYEGFDLAAAGEEREAETYFQQALTTPTPVLPGASPALLELQSVADRLLNAQIHLELARIRMSSDQDEAAATSLASAIEALDASEKEWIESDLALLEARLEIRRGEHEKAYRRLRKNVLQNRRLDTAEGLLLLAIAARESGHADDFAQALAGARKKGADVSRLLE
jgi:hypothetical protein